VELPRMTLATVSEVTAYLKELFAIDPVLGDIWVRGEASNLSRPASGHLYCTLREGDTALRAVAFRQQVRTFDYLPQDGDAVLAHGRIAVYEASGQYQLYIDTIQPDGVGVGAALFERLRRQLEGEGLFDESRKRPLPRAPKTIGVVTSETGAVWHDIQTVVSRRYPLTRLVLAPTSVQGLYAPDEIVRALRQIQDKAEAEVVIVGRGGGSAEDLAAFNDERVVRAIFACRVPTVSAVGHETDVTLADFVADVRAATPSAAAELTTPDIREIAADVRSAARALGELTRDQIAEHDADRAALERALERASPRFRIAEYTQRTDDHTRRLGLALNQRLMREQAWLTNQRASLAALDPHAVLARGYALVTDATTGVVLRAGQDGYAGRAVHVRVADGSFAATTTGTLSKGEHGGE